MIYFAGISAGLLVAGLFYHCRPQNQVVIFDTKAVQAQLIRQLAEHKASEDQVSVVMVQFKNKLDSLLLDYAKNHHAIILDKGKVLAGGADITDEISMKLAQSMRGKHED